MSCVCLGIKCEVVTLNRPLDLGMDVEAGWKQDLIITQHVKSMCTNHVFITLNKLLQTIWQTNITVKLLHLC
jgi:hypothetical protein